MLCTWQTLELLRDTTLRVNTVFETMPAFWKHPVSISSSFSKENPSDTIWIPADWRF
ncbi:mCG140824 [Mus musculus]|nr:mCG140824 [Mus musculus]